MVQHTKCELTLYLFIDLILFQVASYYAKMLDHDYTSKEIFNKNFFEDWRKEMTNDERKIIKDLKKCDFKEMHAYFVQVNAVNMYWTSSFLYLLDTFDSN